MKTIFNINRSNGFYQNIENNIRDYLNEYKTTRKYHVDDADAKILAHQIVCDFPEAVFEKLNTKNFYDLSTDELMERMRIVSQVSQCSRGHAKCAAGRTHSLVVEADEDNIWVVRYAGLHSVVGNEGLHSALVSMAEHLQSLHINL